MWRLARRGARAHLVRFVLTGLAIVLGMTFLVGSFVITDTIRAAFDDLFTTLTRGTDAVVQGTLARGFAAPGDNAEATRSPVPEQLLSTVRGVPGVARAVGWIQTTTDQAIAIVGRNNKPIGGTTAPQFGYSWTDEPRFTPWRISSGRPPRLDSELVIDAGSARAGNLHIGDRVLVNVPPLPATRYRLVGIARFGRVDRPLGATGALFTMHEAQRIARLPHQFRQILVQARPGVSSAMLVHRLKDALTTRRVDVVTGDEYRTQQQNQVRTALTFLTIALTVFGAIGLLVGAFIIFNTFTIVLTQRTRELALLRAIGATPRQVLGSVLAEAAIVGLTASALGVAAGIGLAAGLEAVLRALAVSIPAGSLVVAPRTIVLGLVVGTIVTTVSAYVPGRRAASVAPLAALRDSTVEPPLVSRRRSGVGLAVGVLGGVGIAIGLFTSITDNTYYAAAGAIALFVGVAIASPVFVRPAARILGAVPIRISGIAGRLARDNAHRNPRRSASTAIALTLGVALVGLITIVAASFQVTIAHALDNQLGTTDFFISGTLSPVVTARVQAVPSVAAAMGVGFAEPSLTVAPHAVNPDDARFVLAMDPTLLPRFVDLGHVSGNLHDLDNGGIAVPRAVARRHHLHVGSIVVARFDASSRRMPVSAIFDKSIFNRPALLIAHSVFERSVRYPIDYFTLALLRPGTPTTVGQHAIERALHDYPTAKVQNFAEFKHAQARQIDQALFLVYGLLLLAIVIAFIGIVNTLALSVYERTREIGLLRAVGTSRRQVAASIGWESVIISVFGTALGLVVGVVFGWVLVLALRRQHLVTRFDPALGRLAVIALVAATAGAIAAVVPARRASKLDILAAIRSE